ncbi:MAG: polysaccharide deacetylase family protein, partial [Lachnospiraceae bacterium]|nr:polysaccharide deacetylase family protein [Lachnospiraceae bacterium]
KKKQKKKKESTASEASVSENKEVKYICLTLDDGPGIYTNRFLDLLEQYQAKATFFMIGEQVGDFASAVRREHDLGMEQGNHSWNHKTLTKLTADEVRWEIAATDDKIEEVTGARPKLFRPPGGGFNDFVLENGQGHPFILWSIDTEDWKTKDADATYNCVMTEARDGAVILCHEIYEATLQAAERFIPDLIAEGYRFVTISEMAELRGRSLEAGKKYNSF